MDIKKLIGILLILIGLASFVYEGVTFKTKEKVLQIGSTEVTAEKTKQTIPFSPIVGGVAIIGGLFLVMKRS